MSPSLCRSARFSLAGHALLDAHQQFSCLCHITYNSSGGICASKQWRKAKNDGKCLVAKTMSESRQYVTSLGLLPASASPPLGSNVGHPDIRCNRLDMSHLISLYPTYGLGAPWATTKFYLVEAY
jgi:hypothetical protein